jgi:very-short-patch-repair endonuclease
MVAQGSPPPLWGRVRVGGRAVPGRLTHIARSLRRNATNAERTLWEGLRRTQVAGFRFRRQVVIGGFIADFVAFDARLVVEVDGATHSTDAEIKADAIRSAAIVADGFTILRFTNDEVYRNLDGVLDTIRARLMELRPRTEAIAL